MLDHFRQKYLTRQRQRLLVTGPQSNPDQVEALLKNLPGVSAQLRENKGAPIPTAGLSLPPGAFNAWQASYRLLRGCKWWKF